MGGIPVVKNQSKEENTVKKQYIDYIAQKLALAMGQVSNTLSLFNEGATVPFISRYRKEMTGSLDEVAVGKIKELKERFDELDKRKETVLKSIEAQEALSPELEKKITATLDANELEDLYLPYKPKRRTRATIARERGLEPLAKIMMKQFESNPEGRARQFLSDEVDSADAALAGARDIIAEWVNENQVARTIVRTLVERTGYIHSRVVKGKEEEGFKYRDYFDWREPLKKCASHRMLAMRRGEKEGILKLTIVPDEEQVSHKLDRLFVKGNQASSAEVHRAVEDGYKRLLGPSIENESFGTSKERADNEAIDVFATNLRQLLLAPPLGQKRVLAIDPGYRTGCKVVCLDEQGSFQHYETIFPHKPQQETKLAARKLESLIHTYKIESVAIGNGTASRETEAFVKRLHLERDIQVFVVSEDGASIYSASKVARDEFPQFDVTVRGAISIGRRLLDPLAELVKIDPKSIGVGQYQHDVDQKLLQKSLDSVVEVCVNQVGVNLNTASKHLLTYVSGLGPTLAQNIVDYRTEHGPFASRRRLKDVPRMGPKAFEQSAGFLRIPGAKDPLDNSAVHPESYSIVKQMAKDMGCSVTDLIADDGLRSKVRVEKYVTSEVGMPTLNDILKELSKPGLDPRSDIKLFEFAEGIYKMEDLELGMELPGIVTNITKFGAFVDVGIKQDGLVHISELANRFVSDPNEIVKLHQHVMVKVLEVDIPRKRVNLSMKQVPQ